LYVRIRVDLHIRLEKFEINSRVAYAAEVCGPPDDTHLVEKVGQLGDKISG